MLENVALFSTKMGKGRGEQALCPNFLSGMVGILQIHALIRVVCQSLVHIFDQNRRESWRKSFTAVACGIVTLDKAQDKKLYWPQ